MAKFKTREYDGKTYNQLDTFYDYDPDKVSEFREVKDPGVPW
jgi:hypothetical protein